MPRLPYALLAASALAACASTGGHSDAQSAANAPQARNEEGRSHHARAERQSAQDRAPRIDHRARAQIGREEMLTQMAYWAGEYQTFPDDLEAAQKFAEALRLGGRFDRAAQVSGEALQRFPDDRPLMRSYGLAQIAAKHPQEALRPLALLAQADAQDWKARSSLGVALDELGRFTEARRAYQEALALHPDDPGLLTNLGMSHLLANEPDQAEPILRQAAALPNAPPQARQNLAIAVALQGRFDEAEQLERIDLPPDVAAANMAYLRGLLSDPRRWGDMRQGRS